jgi:hypothetical protein
MNGVKRLNPLKTFVKTVTMKMVLIVNVKLTNTVNTEQYIAVVLVNMTLQKAVLMAELVRAAIGKFLDCYCCNCLGERR